MGTSQTTS